MREELSALFEKVKSIGSKLLRKIGVVVAIAGIAALVIIPLSKGVEIVSWINSTYKQVRVDAALGTYLPQCEYTADYYGTPIWMSFVKIRMHHFLSKNDCNLLLLVLK